MSTPIDFSEFTDDVDDTQLLTVISNTAEQLKEALVKVRQIEGDLAAATHEAKTLAERTLPELMLRAKMESFRTSTGLDITISETVRATIGKDNKPDALDWLRTNGYGALIKTNVKVEFTAGKEAEALKLYEEVSKLNTPSNVAVASDVHSSTFAAWATRRLQEGVELPPELFKVFRQRAAIIE